MSDPKNKSELNEIGILPRVYQNPATTVDATGVFNALEINRITQERFYADQVARENEQAELRIQGKENRRG